MQDQTLSCKGCSAPILFSANQQEFFAKKGFTPPCWCPSCKTVKKNRTPKHLGRRRDYHGKNEQNVTLDRTKGYWYDFERKRPRESGDIEGIPESKLKRYSDNEIYVKQKRDGWNFICSQYACPGRFVDIIYPCTNCGNEYLFTAGEQYFNISKGLLDHPMSCKMCRKEDKDLLSSLGRPQFC